MRELKLILSQFLQTTQPMALATIVGTTGSSYRRAGARMLIGPDAGTTGTLSGGCIEEEVAERALPVIASGQAARFTIDTLRRFGCPGSLDILVERVENPHPFFAYLSEAFFKRFPAEILVSLAEPLGSFPARDHPLGAPGFRQTLLPPIRLILVGAGADSDALIHFSRILGWESLLLEPSEIGDLPVDLRTALIVKNHHIGRDLASLAGGLGHSFGYVGLLSSQKRKRHLLGMLDSEGFLGEEAAFESLYGPAGLDLGADSPEEIALSIIAEIQAVMTGHGAGFLRDSSQPIHQPRCLVSEP